jgi:hypothetical protein
MHGLSDGSPPDPGRSGRDPPRSAPPNECFATRALAASWWHSGFVATRIDFTIGDDLSVQRLGYTHHGILVGADEVVQFGGVLWDKANAGIEVVSVSDFAGNDRVHKVAHDRYDPAKTVGRALWLARNPPPRRYNLIGYNCEHIARWCVTGWESESLQTRAVFATKAVLGGPLLLWIAMHARYGQVPGARLIFAYQLFSLWFVWQYHNEIRVFQAYITANWHGASSTSTRLR